jgi:hypothetical protein
MIKHNWHVALIQETGLIKNSHHNVHKLWWQSLHHHIIFNSPNKTILKDKQRQRKIKKLQTLKCKGTITNKQMRHAINNLPHKTAKPEGGMAILINKNIIPHVHTHKISKLKNGLIYKNKHIMGTSLSINYNNVLLLNIYAPAKGRHVNEQWLDKCIVPIVEQCNQANWHCVIGGDLNTTSN